jgi:hypothetical protein
MAHKRLSELLFLEAGTFDRLESEGLFVVYAKQSDRQNIQRMTDVDDRHTRSLL